MVTSEVLVSAISFPLARETIRDGAAALPQAFWAVITDRCRAGLSR
jgi:hypothetical protein